MSSSKDLGRLVNGVSLIDNKSTRHSQLLESTWAGGTETLISASVNKVVLLATDIFGVSKENFH